MSSFRPCCDRGLRLKRKRIGRTLGGPVVLPRRIDTGGYHVDDHHPSYSVTNVLSDVLATVCVCAEPVPCRVWVHVLTRVVVCVCVCVCVCARMSCCTHTCCNVRTIRGLQENFCPALPALVTRLGLGGRYRVPPLVKVETSTKVDLKSRQVKGEGPSTRT